jgi:2-polyprenyl-3-methyl-5-hydroxy-6-metoxy-1,4-benzoquinol methylase
MNTDKDWNYYGKNNPYYGVFTIAEFDNVNQSELKHKFFKSGESYIEKVLNWIERDFEGFNIQHSSVLDFGCGVGRVVLPLSRMCKSVCGVDISEGMLEEAKRNMLEFNVTNCNFETHLNDVKVKFDLIH